MSMDVKEFWDLRAKIMKNAMLARLLQEYLQKNHSRSVNIGSAVMQVKPETEAYLKRVRLNGKIPRFVQYDIMVADMSIHWWIQLKYGKQPFITFDTPQFLGNQIERIASLVKYLFKKVNLNPAKVDKIFSNTPKDFLTFIENEGKSGNYWRLGYSKKIKHTEPQSFDEDIVGKYYNDLSRKDKDYRIFCRVLLGLFKEQKVEFRKDGVGEISFALSAFSDRINVYYFDYVDNRHYCEVVHIFDMNPNDWISRKYHIDIFVLRNMI